MTFSDPPPQFRAAAILLLGGVGTRFGSDLPKQFHRLCGTKVYLHTLHQLIDAALFEQIVLVCPEQWIEEVERDVESLHPRLLIVAGGATRQESSLKGVLALSKQTELVLIHDAVRPFVSKQILIDNICAARQYHAVDTCIPSADTLVFAPEKNKIASIPDRSTLLRGQTPQTFSYPLILNAHLQAQAEGIHNSSDDCSLVLRIGHPVHVVSGSERNMKITTELDILLAEQLFRMGAQRGLEGIKGGSLAGKKYAITGGTGGIGGAIAELLKEEGALAIPISRSSSDFGADLTSFAATQEVFEKIQQTVGPLDGLINSVGLLQIKEFSLLSEEEIALQISTNLNSVLYSCKCASLKAGAHIINIASSSYFRGKKNYALYSSAKAAIVNFTQALAEERPDLLINAAVPQRTATKMRHENFPEENRDTLVSPESVAHEIVTLLKHPSLTGTIFEIRKEYTV